MSGTWVFRILASTALPLTTMLGGCQSMHNGRPGIEGINSPMVSGDPCKSADWFEVGRIDGLNGVSETNSAYVGRCRARGILPNLELYTAGFERGLVDYCTPERAYDAGRAGESYNGVCPKNLEAKILKRHKVGTEIAALEKKNAALEGQVDLKLSELAAIGGVKPAGEPRDRSTILDDALSRTPADASPEISEKKTMLQSEIRKLRDDLARNETMIQELEKSAL